MPERDTSGRGFASTDDGKTPSLGGENVADEKQGFLTDSELASPAGQSGGENNPDLENNLDDDPAGTSLGEDDVSGEDDIFEEEDASEDDDAFVEHDISEEDGNSEEDEVERRVNIDPQDDIPDEEDRTAGAN